MSAQRWCHKVRYKTLAEAELVLKTIKALYPDDSKRRENRAYKCDVCHRFHLTSRGSGAA